MFQEIISETQPEFIVETGTAAGGSALYWASTLNALGLEKSRVLTVDINDFTKVASADPLWKKYVTYYKGSSIHPAIVGDMLKKVTGHKTMVTLDSNHAMNHVYQELKLYSPMVKRGSYLVVEDTHLDGVPTDPGFGPGPLAGLRKFLDEGGARTSNRIPPAKLCDDLHPGGWLRHK